MSVEAVNQFLTKVAEDAQLQEELAKAMQSENDRQAVTELANNKGYDFTGDELMQEIEKRQQAAADAGELSEEELEAVAGGATPATTFFVAGGIAMTAGITGGVIAKAKW
ncbi:bacteriocin propeptide, TIGR03798 family [Rivularia sp. PCC 7116]|uniref:Nif11-like leader peptide family natural product precursor n=1 Tax=Rivularia sp. PCC 7116 TaxID=373994 RepID=UPI00029F134A|nr:Nif11-like leader peptide family natural product precursor [Rivularia sp. PCC 7116]AFY58614.1 bacteriocin propeptide, TIGR03798 family [Rivularia sp. PCC 7116]